MRRKIISYKQKLVAYARKLRNNSTKSEIYLWSFLRAKQCLGYKFIRQKPIDKYIVDFYCPELLLAIELDGYTHLLEDSYRRDKRKEVRLKTFGISVLRFWDDEVLTDIDNVLRVIESKIIELENNLA